jgi:hypothetical protein
MSKEKDNESKIILPPSQQPNHVVCAFLGNMVIMRQTPAGISQDTAFLNCIKEKCVFYETECLIFRFLKDNIKKPEPK